MFSMVSAQFHTKHKDEMYDGHWLVNYQIYIILFIYFMMSKSLLMIQVGGPVYSKIRTSLELMLHIIYGQNEYSQVIIKTI